MPTGNGPPRAASGTTTTGQRDVLPRMTIWTAGPLTECFGDTPLVAPIVEGLNEPGTLMPMADAIVRPQDVAGQALPGWTLWLSTEVQVPRIFEYAAPATERIRTRPRVFSGNNLFGHVDGWLRDRVDGESSRSVLTFYCNPDKSSYRVKSHWVKITAPWEREMSPTLIWSETHMRLLISLRPQTELDTNLFAAGFLSCPAQCSPGPSSMITTRARGAPSISLGSWPSDTSATRGLRAIRPNTSLARTSAEALLASRLQEGPKSSPLSKLARVDATDPSVPPRPSLQSDVSTSEPSSAASSAEATSNPMCETESSTQLGKAGCADVGANEGLTDGGADVCQ